MTRPAEVRWNARAGPGRIINEQAMNESDIKLDFEGHVAIVESCRPPDNYFDAGLIERLADIYEELDADPA